MGSPRRNSKPGLTGAIPSSSWTSDRTGRRSSAGWRTRSTCRSRRSRELNPEDEIVVYCHVGQRRAAVAEYLTQLGFKNAKTLLGGLDYWAQTVDPAMRT